jgi:hypothetical protein
MTMAKARAQLATSHFWWHGPHCWDAAPRADRIVRRVKPREQEEQGHSAALHNAAQDAGSVPARRGPKWRNAITEMLPAEAPNLASAVPAMAPSDVIWLDGDIAQVAPPSILRRNRDAAIAKIPPPAQKEEPRVRPARLVLIFLSLVVIIVLIELLFRNIIRERLD